MDAMRKVARDWAGASARRVGAVDGEVWGWQWGGETIFKQLARLKPWEHLTSPVVELGCGAGKWTKWLMDNGVEAVVGIDTDPGSIEEAKEYEPRAEFMVGPGDRIPYPDNHFGSMFSFGLILHLPPPLFMQYLLECNRTVRETLVFQVPNLNAPKGARMFLDAVRNGSYNRLYEWGYMNYYTPGQVARYMDLAGFEGEQLGNVGAAAPRDMIVLGRKKR